MVIRVTRLKGNLVFNFFVAMYDAAKKIDFKRLFERYRSVILHMITSIVTLS